MDQDEAEVQLLSGENEHRTRKSSSCSKWQLWKLVIIFTMFLIICVWIMFTMFPTIERISKLNDRPTNKATKSSSLYATKCLLLPQNATTKWSGFMEIVPGTLIYSAYYDETDRNSSFVRMIAISETFRPPILFCHSRCDSQKTEEAKFHLVEGHKDRRHAAFIVSCSFPRGLGRNPGSVSMSAMYDKKRSQVVSFPVQSTLDRGHINNYTVCVPPIYGSVISSMNFIEFIEMNRFLGASNFVIYNEEIHQGLANAVKIYQDQGVVMVLPWNIPNYINNFYGIHYHGQLVSIQDCLYRNRGRTKWVGFHDLDEFIVPLKHPTLPNLLNNINRDQSTSGYCIRSVVLPRNVLTPKKDYLLNSTLLTQQFLFRTKTVFKKYKRSKCIVHPRKVFEMGIHAVTLPVLDGLKLTWIRPDQALVFHYRQCVQFKDIKAACKNLVPEVFMLSYKKRLTKNVDRIMRLIT